MKFKVDLDSMLKTTGMAEGKHFVRILFVLLALLSSFYPAVSSEHVRLALVRL